MLAGCGPGVTDGEWEITNGYSYVDTGSNGKAIYEDKKSIIAPRVDSYKVDGDNIIVARRPAGTWWREDQHGNKFSDWTLADTCEYWMINTRTHEIKQIPDTKNWPTVQCDGKTYGAKLVKNVE